MVATIPTLVGYTVLLKAALGELEAVPVQVAFSVDADKPNVVVDGEISTEFPGNALIAIAATDTTSFAGYDVTVIGDKDGVDNVATLVTSGTQQVPLINGNPQEITLYNTSEYADIAGEDPENTYGLEQIVLTARDSAGNEAVATYEFDTNLNNPVFDTLPPVFASALTVTDDDGAVLDGGTTTSPTVTVAFDVNADVINTGNAPSPSSPPDPDGEFHLAGVILFVDEVMEAQFASVGEGVDPSIFSNAFAFNTYEYTDSFTVNLFEMPVGTHAIRVAAIDARGNTSDLDVYDHFVAEYQ